MFFVYFHVVWFAAWVILIGPRLGGHFPYEFLTMIVSLEAIFLATFIMVAQNRQAELAEEREKEEEQEEEETREELEDIQEDFDSLKKDLEEMRGLLGRLESHIAQRNNVPLKLPQD